MMHTSNPISHPFVSFAIAAQALRFGSFITKAGRESPYFFNAGQFYDGAKLSRLAEFYAQALQKSGLEFDMIMGPAYKGITLACALAIELDNRGRNVPFAYNRKEAKDHGEGGSLVGAPLKGKVLIVDDVISAGTAVGEAVQLIRAAAAEPVGLLIALDRQEKACLMGQDSPFSAVQYVRNEWNLTVIAVATLTNLLDHLSCEKDLTIAQHYAAMLAYQQRYGV